MSETHIARIHYNPSEGGARWWGEDDLGFTGGAERLAELVEMITEWAEAEGVLDELTMRLVPATESPPPPQVEVSEEFRGPLSIGVEATKVGFEVAV